MPEDIGVELQQIMDIKKVEMEQVIVRAQILVANRLEPVIAASGIRQSGAAREQTQKIHRGIRRSNQVDFKGSNRKCFRYGGPHMMSSMTRESRKARHCML